MTKSTACAVAGLALVVLLAAPAGATDVAELPLKASVLAKPNLIFGLDDSGSMDSEVMLGNNDGAFWWDYNARSGWDASGKPWFNAAGGADGQWKKMVYLFPNGHGSIGDRVYADASNDHFAIPPTAQLAFLRSPDYNPIYYDPTVVYAPWSPAYVNGATVTYGNASRTAAKSHPVYGTGVFDVSSTMAERTTANWTFTALPGMRLPGTARVLDGGTWKAVSTMGWTLSGGTYVVPASRQYRLAMEYFPATYYLKQSCTVDGADCVTAPDGSTLRRYEIKPANYPTTAAYEQAIQNFANWWQYYRKRKLMINAAVGQVLEPLTGLQIGALRFSQWSSTARLTMYDTDASSASANGRRVAGFFYETNGSGGTPTREVLDRIGEEYMHTAGPVKYACQRNNAFILTDGFANVSSPSKPSYSKSTWGATAPQATTHDNSLADIALAYYTVNLRPDLAPGRVPKSDTDLNPNLHMNTYGLTMGARGLLFTGQDALPPTDPAAWTNPTQNRHPSAVDDLWHATLNGRGQMHVADSPRETAARIQAALNDILARTGAQGGIAVSTVNLSRGDQRAYFGTYNPSGWAGDLTANPIDPLTAEVGATAAWSAAGLLRTRDWTTRVIAAGKAGAAVPFTAANVGSIVNPGGAYGVDTEVIDYLRGDRTHEGTQFRTRTSLMGAVINSEPMVDRSAGVVYVQSGEGMLHAIDTVGADAGKELWAFVPESALAQIGETAARTYAFRTKLDGSPVVAKLSDGSRILVAGAGVAGRSFYALDVSSPRGLTESGLAAKHLWTFPAVGDATTRAKVGDAMGRPLIVKSVDGDVVLLTSGYNNTHDGKGRLWVLNAATGSVIHEFTVNAGTLAAESGLTHVSGFLEPDNTVRHVYGGDLLGNVWSFDLKDKGAPGKLAVLTGPAGDLQPVTAAPELVLLKGRRVVLVGTGRLLDIGDFGSTKVQSFYAVADGATLASARAGLVRRSYDMATDALTGTTVDWAADRGWYLDLPAGAQANSRPTLAYGAVAFVTNANGGSDCAASSRLWLVDLLSGGAFAGTDYVSSVISETATSSGVTALLTTDGKIIGSGQDADGKPWQRDITDANPITPAKNAWREIRRQ